MQRTAMSHSRNKFTNPTFKAKDTDDSYLVTTTFDDSNISSYSK